MVCGEISIDHEKVVKSFEIHKYPTKNHIKAGKIVSKNPLYGKNGSGCEKGKADLLEKASKKTGIFQKLMQTDVDFCKKL